MPNPIALILTPVTIKTAQPAETLPIEIPAQDIQRAIINDHYLFIDLLMGLKPLSSQELNQAREDIATSINRYSSAYLKATIRAAQASLIAVALDMEQLELLNPNLTLLLEPTSLCYAEVVRELTKTHLSQNITALLPGDEIEYNGHHYAWNPENGQDNDLDFLREEEEVKGKRSPSLKSLKQLHTICKDVLFSTCLKTAQEHYVFQIKQETKAELRQKITTFKQEEAEARAICNKLRAEQLPLDDRLQTARTKFQTQQRLIQTRRQKIIECAERLFADKGTYAPLSFLTQLELVGIAPGKEHFHEQLADVLLHQSLNPLAIDLRDHQTLCQMALTASRNITALTHLSISPESMSFRQLRASIFIAKEQPFQDLPEATIAIILHEKNFYQVDLRQHPITPLTLLGKHHEQLISAFSGLATGATRAFEPPPELVAFFPSECTLLKIDSSPENLSVTALKALLKVDKPSIAFDGHTFYRINLERSFIQLLTASTVDQQEEHEKLHVYFAAPQTAIEENKSRLATSKEQRLITPIKNVSKDSIFSTFLMRCEEYLLDPTVPKDVEHNTILHTVALLAATHSNHHSLDPVFKTLSTILETTTRIKDNLLKHQRAADGLPPLSSEIQNAQVKQQIKEALLEENLQGKSPLDLFLKANRSPFLPLLLDYISKNEAGQDVDGTSAFQQVVLKHLKQFAIEVAIDLDKLKKDSKKSKRLCAIEYQHNQAIAVSAAADQPPALKNDSETRAFLRNFNLQALQLAMFKAANEAYDPPLRDAIIDRACDNKDYLGWYEFYDPLFHRLVKAALQFTKKELQGHYERPVRLIGPRSSSTPDARELAAIKVKLSEVEQEATRTQALLALNTASYKQEVMKITADFSVCSSEIRKSHDQKMRDVEARSAEQIQQTQERYEAVQAEAAQERAEAAQERAEALTRDKKTQLEFTIFKETAAEREQRTQSEFTIFKETAAKREQETQEKIDRLTALVENLLEKQQQPSGPQAGAPRIEENSTACLLPQPRLRRPSLFLEASAIPIAEVTDLASATNQ